MKPGHGRKEQKKFQPRPNLNSGHPVERQDNGGNLFSVNVKKKKFCSFQSAYCLHKKDKKIGRRKILRQNHFENQSKMKLMKIEPYS